MSYAKRSAREVSPVFNQIYWAMWNGWEPAKPEVRDDD